jgi:hypothetical protein
MRSSWFYGRKDPVSADSDHRPPAKGGWQTLSGPGRGRYSQDTAALDQPDEDHDDGRDEQDVNEASHGGTGHKTKNPKDQENNGDGH